MCPVPRRKPYPFDVGDEGWSLVIAKRKRGFVLLPRLWGWSDPWLGPRAAAD